MKVFSVRYDRLDMRKHVWGLELIEPQRRASQRHWFRPERGAASAAFRKIECGSISPTGATIPPAAPPVPTRDRATVQKSLFVESEVARVERTLHGARLHGCTLTRVHAYTGAERLTRSNQRKWDAIPARPGVGASTAKMAARHWRDPTGWSGSRPEWRRGIVATRPVGRGAWGINSEP